MSALLKRIILALVAPLLFIVPVWVYLVFKAPHNRALIGLILIVFYLLMVAVLVVFKTARYIFCLALPSLWTSKLRSILLLYLLSLAGESFYNAAVNATDFVDQSTCAHIKFKELAADLDDGQPFSAEPVYNFFMNAQERYDEIETRIDELKKNAEEAVRKLDELFGDVVKDCEAYILKNLFYRCKAVVENILKECGTPCKLIENIEKIVCEPLRGATVACEAAKGAKKVVDEAKDAARDAVKAAIEKAKQNAFYQMAKEVFHELEVEAEGENSYSVKVQSNMGKLREVIRKWLRRIGSIKSVFDYVLEAATLLLLLWPFYKAWRFAIRASRQRQEVDNRLRHTALECAHLVRVLYLTLAALSIIFLFLLTDWLVYIALSIVNFILQRAEFQLPKDAYQVQFSRFGFINQLLAGIIDNVGPIMKDAEDVQWRQCFQLPTAPAWILQVVLAFACLLLCPLQIYSSRLKPLVYNFIHDWIEADDAEVPNAWP